MLNISDEGKKSFKRSESRKYNGEENYGGGKQQ